MHEPPRGSLTPVSPGADVDPADADFLFHLYRGSELLRDNKVSEAKDEIEHALKMQPRDSLGQDLLARVYFRLGLYPRAIALYEAMVSDYPHEVSPRVNVALCYLKTGQPDLARQHLEQAVTADPTRIRAWGYLGLAFERLGDLEKARAAFERGGHHAMARRVDDTIAARSATVDEQPPPSSTTPLQIAEVRRVAEEAFHELDMSDMAFSFDAGIAPREQPDAGSWRAVEMGQSVGDDAPSPMSMRGTRVPLVSEVVAAEAPMSAEPSAQPRTAAPLAAELVREVGFVFPRAGRLSKRADGSVLVTTDGEFACRLDLARALSTSAGMPTASVLRRRGRGGDSEPPVGDPIRPMYVLGGATHVVMCTAHDRTLQIVDLRDDQLAVREESVAGFDLRLAMESGRMPSGHGDLAPMLQLRGSGCVVLESRGAMGTMELRGTHTHLVRGPSLIGWVGRPSVRNVPLSEAPANGRGWLAFMGDGWLLVDTSPSQDFGQM